MVSAAQQTRLRETQQRFMPDTCQVVRRTDGTRDAFGDRTETWAVVATVPCRLAAMGGGTELVTGFRALTSVTGYVLTVPHTTDIRAADRIVYGGRTYQIDGDVTELNYQSAKRAYLTRLEQS